MMYGTTYKDLKMEILRDIGYLNDPKVFRKYVDQIQDSNYHIVIDNYIFEFVTAYRAPIGDHDQFYFIYKISNGVKIANGASIFIMWAGSYDSQNGISLYCDFGDFEFVKEDKVIVHVALNESELHPWIIDVQPLPARTKMAPIYTLQKILKEYNIDLGDYIPQVIFDSILENRKGRVRAPNVAECLITDIEIENLKILKHKSEILVELKFMDEYFLYTAHKDYGPDACLRWFWKIEYMDIYCVPLYR